MATQGGHSNLFGTDDCCSYPLTSGGCAMPIDNAERERRRTLVRAHLAAENDHDLDRIMRTFSDGTVMLYNGRSFTDHERIRWAHSYFGWSSVQGAFAGLRVSQTKSTSPTTSS